MRSITLHIPEPGDWDAYYSVQNDADHLFVPTDQDITVGEVIRVKVVFRRGPQFFLSGVVIWRRAPARNRSPLRPGVGLRLNTSERSKVAYIRGYARGGFLDKRAAPRVPVRLQVTYGTDGARRVNFTRDLTTTGMLISAAECLPVGSPVDLTVLRPGERGAMRLRGTVVRHVEDDRGRAMGVQLAFEDAAERRRWEGWVSQVERQFQSGELGEAHIAR